MNLPMLRPLLCAGCLLIGAQLHPSPAQAQEPTVVRSLTVDISDLDLSRRADVHKLHRRIERAAQKVCGPSSFAMTPDPPGYVGYETCYDRALKNALARVDTLAHPALASATSH